MGRQLTISEVAKLTGLHKNTIRNYIKDGKLKADLAGNKKGNQRLLIDEEYLYNCGIPNIVRRIGNQDAQEPSQIVDIPQDTDTSMLVEEYVRLTREHTAAMTELGILKTQIPALKAAEEEKIELSKENMELSRKVSELEMKSEELEASRQELREKIVSVDAELRVKESELYKKDAEIGTKEEEVEKTREELKKKEEELIAAITNMSWLGRRRYNKSRKISSVE